MVIKKNFQFFLFLLSVIIFQKCCYFANALNSKSHKISSFALNDNNNHKENLFTQFNQVNKLIKPKKINKT
jgi:hypothetical protein